MKPSKILKITYRLKQISSFEISDILKAASNSRLKPNHKSRGRYYNFYENDFLVFPDGKTLVGEGSGILQFEDITREEVPVEIDEGTFCTMVFNGNLQVLLTGDRNGCVSQYKLDSSGNFLKEKEYDVGVGWVQASDYSGDLAVMGGDNGKISFIDMRRGLMLQNRIETAIGKIFSLQFCRVSEGEMHLAVAGKQTCYSPSKSDWFDVSTLFKPQKTRADLQIVQNLIRQNKQLRENQQVLKLQIQKLQMDLENQTILKSQIHSKNQQLDQTIQLLQTKLEKQKGRSQINSRFQKDKLNQHSKKFKQKNEQNRLRLKDLRNSMKIVENLKVGDQMKTIKHLKKTFDKLARGK